MGARGHVAPPATGATVLNTVSARSAETETNDGNNTADVNRHGDIHMQTGMADYDRSLRKRLLWLVIVLPMAGLLLLLYLLNVS